MPSPAEHAAAIRSWLGNKDLATVERELAAAPSDHPLLLAGDALADAADAEDERLRGDGLAALFSGVVEPLNDGFTPAGRALYGKIFARVLARAMTRDPSLSGELAAAGIADENALYARWRRLRDARRAAPARYPRRIAVLSRVTIGADILLVSVALQRLHQRYPAGELVLIGDAKLSGLFAGMAGVRVLSLAYRRRGRLGERLSSWGAVRAAIAAADCDLVLSPDSRLDQLGLLPVCADERYLLWENTQPDMAAPRGLAELFDQWLVDKLALPGGRRVVPTLGLDVAARVAQRRLAAAFGTAPIAAVKLDHGGNAAKALPAAAEAEVLHQLRARGWRVLIDRGFGADEVAASDALLARLGWTARDIDDADAGRGEAIDGLAAGALAREPVIRFHGSISGWAAAVANCGLAFSYDSVGHHLAAALGVPVIVAFTGHADPAFAIAWRPQGRAAVDVIEIPTSEKDRPVHWRRVADAIPYAPGVRRPASGVG